MYLLQKNIHLVITSSNLIPTLTVVREDEEIFLIVFVLVGLSVFKTRYCDDSNYSALLKKTP